MGFNTGDVSIAANAITVEFDLDKDNNFHVACLNNFSEALNYVTETWTDFCSDGFSSSAMTGLDPEWSGEMMLKFKEFSSDLTKKRYNVQELNNIPMRITNKLLEQVVTVQVAFTSFEMTMVAEELLKISFAVKPFSGAPIVSDYVEPAVPTNLAVDSPSITDASAKITWTETVNTTTDVFLNGVLVVQALADSPYIFTDLTASTNYSVTIRSRSVEGFTSAKTAPVTFRTLDPMA